MTEAQAWARAAKLKEGSGLCLEIAVMVMSGAISVNTSSHMMARLKSLARKRGLVVDLRFYSHLWPPDDKGNRLRVQFCRRQIKALRGRP
jgi:hypothetical protein